MCVSVFVLFFSLLWQPWFLHAFTYSLKTNAKNYQVQHLKLLFVPALEVAIVLAIAASENHIKNLAELQLLSENLEAVKKSHWFYKHRSISKGMEDVIPLTQLQPRCFSSCKSTEHPSPQNLQGLHCTKG